MRISYLKRRGVCSEQQQAVCGRGGSSKPSVLSRGVDEDQLPAEKAGML
jgi:hypothetical protein